MLSFEFSLFLQKYNILYNVTKKDDSVNKLRVIGEIFLHPGLNVLLMHDSPEWHQ